MRKLSKKQKQVLYDWSERTCVEHMSTGAWYKINLMDQKTWNTLEELNDYETLYSDARRYISDISDELWSKQLRSEGL